nr:PREDICTED: interleukin-1 receptor type 2 [Latimeria chalumnae]|eukprot:XP_014348139.1 PREDICTED: interleukin-1 receptor type 2 [Latimeria chalumnae]
MDFSDATNHGFNLTWYKNDSGRVIPEGGSRIHTENDSLWFLPTTLEDSGYYVCVLRNVSYCIEVGISLAIYDGESNHFNQLAYPQTIQAFTTGKVVCPDVFSFLSRGSRLELKWYKGSVPLSYSEGKFMSSTNYLLIQDVSMGDGGYYTCEYTFTRDNTQHKVSRIIKVMIKDQVNNNYAVIVSPTHYSIEAALGSQLIIPCKVFTGFGSDSFPLVMWLANNTLISDFFKDNRVREEQKRDIRENGANYVEVELIFAEVRQEDFTTDFKCFANDYGHVIESVAQIKPAAPSFAWYIVVASVALTCLIAAGICTCKWKRAKVKKQYILAMT